MSVPFLCRCGGPFIKHTGESTTLVGYYSEDGHDHDDNCLKRVYICADEHRTLVSLQRSCDACDWKGKERCFCHEGDKVTMWPDSTYGQIKSFDENMRYYP